MLKNLVGNANNSGGSGDLLALFSQIGKKLNENKNIGKAPAVSGQNTGNGIAANGSTGIVNLNVALLTQSRTEQTSRRK